MLVDIGQAPCQCRGGVSMPGRGVNAGAVCQCRGGGVSMLDRCQIGGSILTRRRGRYVIWMVFLAEFRLPWIINR